MSLSDSPEASLLRLVPPIRRARDYRLYDQNGKRYLDLYLADGRALMGHRPPRTLLELKNLVSRGLMSGLPSVFERRLAKAVVRLIPDFPVVRVFSNEERLAAALGPLPELHHASPAAGPVGAELLHICEPLVSSGREGRLQRWRPFSDDAVKPPEVSAVVPVLPFPASFAPAVACLRGIDESLLPPSDLVSPALLGALTYSVYDLLRFADRYSSESWSRFDAPWWRRQGPYLIATCGKSEYSEIFRRLLEKGILINPCYPGPSIVPAEYTDGELKPLRSLAREWSGRLQSEEGL